MAKQNTSLGRRWYVIRTNSGYEENVAQNLRQRIESMNMEEKIFNVLIPTEKKIKIKNGKRKVVTEKIYPGYVYVEMIMDDDSWYVVRNTPNVSGLIGIGTTPSPLSDDDIKRLQKAMSTEQPKYHLEVEVGMLVKIIDGPFKNFEGKVSEIDESRGKIKVKVNMFGRETPVELDSLQVKKV